MYMHLLIKQKMFTQQRTTRFKYFRTTKKKETLKSHNVYLAFYS